MKKTPLEQLSFWIEKFQRINGTPSLEEIKGQIELLKDYEQEQLRICAVGQVKPEVCEHKNTIRNNDTCSTLQCKDCGKYL